MNPNDGITGSSTWTYSVQCGTGTPRTSSMIVSDPSGNDTVHNSTDLGIGVLDANFYETQTLYYQGSHTSGTLLETVNTNYSSVQAQLANTMFNSVYEVLPTRVTTIWPNGKQTKIEHDYDTGHTFTCPDAFMCQNQPFTYDEHVADRVRLRRWCTRSLVTDDHNAVRCLQYFRLSQQQFDVVASKRPSNEWSGRSGGLYRLRLR